MNCFKLLRGHSSNLALWKSALSHLAVPAKILKDKDTPSQVPNLQAMWTQPVGLSSSAKVCFSAWSVTEALEKVDSSLPRS